MPAAEAGDFPKSDYKEYPKILARDDFWGQVRRTINGKSVGEEQIAMIVQAILLNLQPTGGDTLLDLACGNGALSRHLFAHCKALVGVDYSPYLIEIAKANFERAPQYVFSCQDAAAYVESAPHPDRPTKLLCYGSFSFFSEADARRILHGLRQRFPHLRAIYLGNLPDRARAENFYPRGKDFRAEIDNHAAQIGIWRTEAQLLELARNTGWRARIVRMPTTFFGAHYRYDALLEPDVPNADLGENARN